MRALLAAVLFLLLVPSTAAATAGAGSLEVGSCRAASPDEPVVFQTGCTYGGHVCVLWFSQWDHPQGQARSRCAVW